MKQLFFSAAIALVDAWMAVIPRRRPPRAALEQAKIVSHRGEHDNRAVLENTMTAFERAVAAGVWGIEADIRWTADLVPVIIHDADTARVFSRPVTIAEADFATLRAAEPQVPTLAELVDAFGTKVHLMLELKAEPFPQLERQKRILREHLAGLKPGRDYHFMALDPALFETFDITPRDCCLAVGMENARSLSAPTLAGGYGGLTGHFLMLDNGLKQRHEAAGQRIGTGFIRSRNCLFREINREVEWIFTNDAVRLRRAVEAELHRG